MKTCNKCNRNLSEDQFYSRPDRPSKTHPMCKECFNTYCIERWKNRKLFAIEFLGNICKDCGKSFHPNVFEFHHRDPNMKEMSWHKMRLVSQSKLIEELEKCDLLCANCHRMRHVNN